MGRRVTCQALLFVLLLTVMACSTQAFTIDRPKPAAGQKSQQASPEKEATAAIKDKENKGKSIEQLCQEADAVLRLPNVDGRTKVDIVFEAANRLKETGKNEKAIKYYLKGLELFPWSLENQLLCAKLLMMRPDKTAAEEKLELVAKYAEDGELAAEAMTLLGGRFTNNDKQVKPLGKIDSQEHVLVLISMNQVNNLLLTEVAGDLQEELEIRVVVQKADIELPAAKRDKLKSYFAKLRNMADGTLDTPLGRSALAVCNMTAEELEDDKKLIRFLKKLLSLEGNEDKVEKFSENIKRLQKGKQWDADELMLVLESTVKPFATEKTGYLGITNKDIFTKDYNFLFGWARRKFGVMSYHRFRADFNNEAPNRQRLRKRTLKQCLSSACYIFGAPRCTNPICARAYPNDLWEHDAKGEHLCRTCKRELAERFGEK